MIAQSSAVDSANVENPARRGCVDTTRAIVLRRVSSCPRASLSAPRRSASSSRTVVGASGDLLVGLHLLCLDGGGDREPDLAERPRGTVERDVGPGVLDR